MANRVMIRGPRLHEGGASALLATPILMLAFSAGCTEDRLCLVNRQVLAEASSRPPYTVVPVHVLEADAIRFNGKATGRIAETQLDPPAGPAVQTVRMEGGRIAAVQAPSGDAVPYAVSEEWEPDRPPKEGKLVTAYPLTGLPSSYQAVPLSALEYKRFVPYSKTQYVVRANGIKQGRSAPFAIGFGVPLLLGGLAVLGYGGALLVRHSTSFDEGDLGGGAILVVLGVGAVGSGLGLTILGARGLTEKQLLPEPDLKRLDESEAQ